MEPFIGQIMLFGFNYAPYGWHICDGSELQIAEYEALYQLIGTTYGGDGVTTFAVPDLRGRVPIHMGQGRGMSNYALGQKGGTETVTLTSGQMPQHSHRVAASSAQVGATGTPSSAVVFASTSGPQIYAAQAGTIAGVLAPSVGLTGGGQSHQNMMPTLAANYCIALFGVYPDFS